MNMRSFSLVLIGLAMFLPLTGCGPKGIPLTPESDASAPDLRRLGLAISSLNSALPKRSWALRSLALSESILRPRLGGARVESFALALSARSAARVAFLAARRTSGFASSFSVKFRRVVFRFIRRHPCRRKILWS